MTELDATDLPLLTAFTPHFCAWYRINMYSFFLSCYHFHLWFYIYLIPLPQYVRVTAISQSALLTYSSWIQSYNYKHITQCCSHITSCCFILYCPNDPTPHFFLGAGKTCTQLLNSIRTNVLSTSCACVKMWQCEGMCLAMCWGPVHICLLA